MAQLFLNNCYGVLDTPAAASDTTLVLTQMHGFPDTMGEGDWFTLTVFADSSRYGVNIEVVKVTAIDDTLLTVERGYEGDAVAHGAGERVEARLTADAMQRLRDLASLPSWEVGDIRTVVKHVELSDDWAPLDGRVIPRSEAPGLVDIGGAATRFEPTPHTLTQTMVDDLDLSIDATTHLGDYAYEADSTTLRVLDPSNDYSELASYSLTGSAFFGYSIVECDGLVIFSSGNSGAPILWSSDGVAFQEGPTVDGADFLGSVFVKLPDGTYLVPTYGGGTLNLSNIPSLTAPGVVTPSSTRTFSVTGALIASFQSPSIAGRYMAIFEVGQTSLYDAFTDTTHGPYASPTTLLVGVSGDYATVLYSGAKSSIARVEVDEFHRLREVSATALPPLPAAETTASMKRASGHKIVTFAEEEGNYTHAVVSPDDPNGIILLNSASEPLPLEQIQLAAAYEGKLFVADGRSVGSSLVYVESMTTPAVPDPEVVFSVQEDSYSHPTIDKATAGTSTDSIIHSIYTSGSSKTGLALVDHETDGYVVYRVTSSDGGATWSLTSNYRPVHVYDKTYLVERNARLFIAPRSQDLGVVYSTWTSDTPYTNGSGTPPMDDVAGYVPPVDGYPFVFLHANGDISLLDSTADYKARGNKTVQATYLFKYDRSPMPTHPLYDPTEFRSGTIVPNFTDGYDPVAKLLIVTNKGVFLYTMLGTKNIVLDHVVSVAEINLWLAQLDGGTGDINYLEALDAAVLCNNNQMVVAVDGDRIIRWTVGETDFSYEPIDARVSQLLVPGAHAGGYLFYGTAGEVAIVSEKTGEADTQQLSFYNESSPYFIQTLVIPLQDEGVLLGNTGLLRSGDTQPVRLQVSSVEVQGFDPATQFYLPDVPTGSEYTLNYVKIR